jgi:hypothetical protein
MGRNLSDIWSYGDKQIEETHDFIQFLFPLNEPSKSSFHGFYLKEDDVLEIIQSNEAKKNIIKSSEWFIGFLDRNTNWQQGYNHNQLRITRVIKCLRLLVGDDAADHWRDRVIEFVEDTTSISDECLNFWMSA